MEDAETTRCVNDLLDDVDLAARDRDVDGRRHKLETIVGRLEAIQKAWPDPSVSYALGYAWYAHPSRLSDESVYRAVEKHLSVVLDAKPGDPLSWLYLGHNAYDLGHLETALGRFNVVAIAELPDYLALKTREMIACCHIGLTGLDGAVEELDRFVSVAEGMAAEDIWPQELARTLATQLLAADPVTRKRLEPLCERLDRAGRFGRWFSELIGSP